MLKSCQRTYQAALDRDADIVYDSIGVGHLLAPKFSEIIAESAKSMNASRISYQRFNAGAGVNEPDYEYIGIPNTIFRQPQSAQARWLVAGYVSVIPSTRLRTVSSTRQMS